MNSRMKLFVQEYVKIIAQTGVANGKQAALNAGYARSSASVQSAQLIRRDDVKAYMAELNSKAIEKRENAEIEAIDHIEQSKAIVAEQIAEIRKEIASIEIPPALQRRADGMTIQNYQEKEVCDGDGNIITRTAVTETKELPPEVQGWNTILNTKAKLRRQLDTYLERQRLLEGGAEHKGTVNIIIAKQDINL